MANETGMGMRLVVGKIRNIKTFLLQQRTRVRIIPQETPDQINCPPPLSSNVIRNEGICSHANCSSYNMGFPLRTCVRVCSVIGMLSSLLYIIAGTSLITHIHQTETIGFSTFTAPHPPTATTRHIYYKRNVGFFIGIAVILVILNVIQLLSDLFLFISTFRPKKYNSLWVNMVLHITLWIMTLICFITIFSGGGLFLLLVFLLGTAIRAYITFILHEYMVDDTFKIHEEEDLSRNLRSTDLEKCTPSPTPKDQHHHHHHLPSPIPEEITTVETFSEIENNEDLKRGDVDADAAHRKDCEDEIIKPENGEGCNQPEKVRQNLDDDDNTEAEESNPDEKIRSERSPTAEDMKLKLDEAKCSLEDGLQEKGAGESTRVTVAHPIPLRSEIRD